MKGKKKVILFIRNIEGGVASYVKGYLKHRDWDKLFIKLVLVTDDEPGMVRISDILPADESVVFKFSNKENQYYVLKRLSKLVDDPEAIVWANERMELSMMNLFRLPNTVISFLHGTGPYYLDTVKQFSGVADAFLGVSDWLRQRAEEIVNAKGGGCKVYKVFGPVPEIACGAPEWPLQPVQLVYAGRLEEAKGALLIPEFCRKLDRLGLEYRFSLVGTGELESWLKQELSANPSVNFTGQLNQAQLFELLNGKHIFVFPSLSEAVGLAVVEAMKAGLVPVTFDLESGLPEFVINGETGFRVALEDIDAMAERVAQLQADPRLWARLRENAVNKARTLFDPTDQAAKLDQVLIEMGKTEKCDKRFFKKNRHSRLDTPVLPNAIVRMIRRVISGFGK